MSGVEGVTCTHRSVCEGIMFLLLWILVICTGHAEGQDEAFTFTAYKFYFHDAHNLLLVTNARHCYFITVEDENDKETPLHQHKSAVEWFVIKSITKNENIQPSSLDEMRSLYSDLLADYHCINKTISRMEVDLVDLTSEEAISHDYLFLLWDTINGDRRERP